MLYDQQSEHQHIMVLDTTEFGKLLVLDDQANLAESDLVYTTTLMGGGTEDFKDKQVDHYQVVISDVKHILTDPDSRRWGWGIAM